MTKKQKQEIDFLVKHFCKRQPTEQEISEYLLATVHGQRDKEDKLSDNPLRNAKQRLDIQIELWRNDLVIGLIDREDLIKELDSPFATKIINKIINSVTKEYRLEKLTKYGGTILSITNFPHIVETFKLK